MSSRLPERAVTSNTWSVIAFLSLSLLLRWALVIRGGQYYFSDEHRYEVSREVVARLVEGQASESLRRLFTSPEHLGIKIVGIFPALVERLLGPSLLIPALFFSLFSVFNLYLIYLLARRAGGTDREALFALGIAAASHSLLYYARHLMPYDTAITFGLLSLYIGLRKDTTIHASLLCGSLGFLCFITYNGYWILAGVAILSHVFAGEPRVESFRRRGILSAIGFAAPLLLVLLLSGLAGVNFFAEYTKFANTVTQGDFSEGWSLPFEYFWHSEHLLIVILGALALIGIINLFRSHEKYPAGWLAGIAFVYGCLVWFSVFTHSFVVLGRLARQVMPFLVLLSAYGLAHLAMQRSYGRNAARLFMIVIALQGFWNYGNSYAISYPREFADQAQRQYQDFTFSPKRLLFGAPELCQNNGYAMENAKYFLSAPETRVPVEGTVLLSQSHPINFLPYQYEGYSPHVRQQFRQRQLQMSFYKLADEVEPKTIKNCFINE